MTSVSIVTPWWQAPELAADYWRAMGFADPDEIIVIDNGSMPPVFVPDADERVRVIRLERNVGFSRASNLGLREAESDAVLFLNNDIRASGDWLTPIREALRPGVLVGAQLRAEAHTAVDGRVVPYLDGWCLAGLKDDLEALGGWDEAYEEPAYYSDNDLCARAVAAGFELVPLDLPLQHISNYTSKLMDVRAVSARNRERYVARVRELLAVPA